MNKAFIVVPFQGEFIDCTTELDAVAVRFADRILCGRETANVIELQRVAAILDHYGRNAEAKRLRTEAHRSHAATLVGKTVIR